MRRFNHNDVSEAQKLLKTAGHARPLLVVDSVYSMTGEFAPIEDLCALAKDYAGLLYVDDAHGTAVYGRSGGGFVTHVFERLPPHILLKATQSSALTPACVAHATA